MFHEGYGLLALPPLIPKTTYPKNGRPFSVTSISNTTHLSSVHIDYEYTISNLVQYTVFITIISTVSYRLKRESAVVAAESGWRVSPISAPLTVG